jgi:hypothetical protein
MLTTRSLKPTHCVPQSGNKTKEACCFAKVPDCPRLGLLTSAGCMKRSPDIAMRRLTMGIRSEKCVVRQFRRCANVIECNYTNLDSTV